MGIKIPLLPPDQDVETKSVMRQLAASHRYLALLNRKSATIPNENILINTLVLQEAKESSAIENIITSHIVRIYLTTCSNIHIPRLISWSAN